MKAFEQKQGHPDIMTEDIPMLSPPVPKRDRKEKKLAISVEETPRKTDVKSVKLFEPFANPNDTFRQIDWFGELTGELEEDVRADLKKYIAELDRPVTDFIPGKKYKRLGVRDPTEGKCVDAGCLAVVSMDDLLSQMFDLREKKPLVENCKFVFLVREDDESVRFVDIAAQQASKDNANAMFQVASNFNGVEACDEDYAPDMDNFLTNYVHDMTQGPTASVSVGGAAITRCLAPFYDKSKKPEEWCQTEDRQIEMLSELKEYFRVTNGYVTNTGHEKPFPVDKDEVEKLYHKMKVVVHLDAEVTSGARIRRKAEKLKEPHRVNQVFCAAMNLEQGASGEENAKLPDTNEKATFLLRAAYEATYMAAICRGCEKLFLTLIGGGAFGNDQRLIHKVIASCHARMTKKCNTSLREVYLSYYGKPNPEVFAEMKADLEKRGCPYVVFNCSEGKAVMQ